MQARLAEGSRATQGLLTKSCEAQPGFYVWFGVQVGVLGLFLLWGAFLAYKIREVPTAFNESTHIMMSLFALIFSGIILIPVAILVGDNPEATVIIQGLSQPIVALVLTVVLFGPKLYYIYTGQANDTRLSRPTVVERDSPVTTSSSAVVSRSNSTHNRQNSRPKTEPEVHSKSMDFGASPSGGRAKLQLASAPTVPTADQELVVLTMDGSSSTSSLLQTPVSQTNSSTLSALSSPPPVRDSTSIVLTTDSTAALVTPNGSAPS
jgi:hypothetical protein